MARGWWLKVVTRSAHDADPTRAPARRRPDPRRARGCWPTGRRAPPRRGARHSFKREAAAVRMSPRTAHVWCGAVSQREPSMNDGRDGSDLQIR
jgi:hypothetical protein